MTDKIYYSGFVSSFGPVFVASTSKGVCLISFSKITETKFLSLLRKRFQKDIIRNDKVLANVRKGLLD